MTRIKGMLAAIGLTALALGGAASAQQPITSASPTAVATDSTAGATPPAVTSATPPAAAPAAPASAGAAPVSTTPAAAAKKVIPQFYKPTPGIGQPTDSIGLQPQETELGLRARHFHDAILLPMTVIISLFVLLLLLILVGRYNRRVNATPSTTSHNTLLEVAWTVAPVLILAGMAVPSIGLLAAQYDTPKPDLTVKVIGHQWYWSYQYPDNGDFEVVSNILTDQQDKERGEPRQLGVDERMVVPAGKVVKIITTSDDVIHSFAVPAFWTKMDAVPGRLNETWFKVDRPGLYYGQCSELCGARHGYMPIAVEVVTDAQWRQWIAARGGTIGGKATSSDATQNSPVSNPSSTTAKPGAYGQGVNDVATENASATAQPYGQRATNN